MDFDKLYKIKDQAKSNLDHDKKRCMTQKHAFLKSTFYTLFTFCSAHWSCFEWFIKQFCHGIRKNCSWKIWIQTSLVEIAEDVWHDIFTAIFPPQLLSFSRPIIILKQIQQSVRCQMTEMWTRFITDTASKIKQMLIGFIIRGQQWTLCFVHAGSREYCSINAVQTN